jgi:hypothetical protein
MPAGAVGVVPAFSLLTAKAAVSSYDIDRTDVAFPVPNSVNSRGAPARGTCHNAHAYPTGGAGIEVDTNVTALPLTSTFAGEVSPARSSTT